MTTTIASRSFARRLLVAGALTVGIAGGALAAPASAQTIPGDLDLDLDFDCSDLPAGCPTFPVDPPAPEPQLPIPGPTDYGFDVCVLNPDICVDPLPDPSEPGDDLPESGDPDQDQPTDPENPTDPAVDEAEVDQAIPGRPTFTG